MIHRIEYLFRQCRRHLSRSEWLVRLLGLSVSSGSGMRPGLIMIQIDGLSHPEFIKALEHGELPFVSQLMQRERYQLHQQYAGLPSSTPACQGELFYGVKAAVPAFGFKDPLTQKMVRMYEPEIAARVEKELLETGHEPLLKGGSSYSNIYTGGADESHFCPSSLGWGNMNLLTTLLLIVTHLYSFLRVGALLVLEFILAVVDLIKGVDLGYSFIKELTFIPSRVGICILLRELIVIGSKIDINRGLPIIHMNFLGYDEQAHRRGPDSLFAHWTLKGIDDAIARVWRASNHAIHRDYEVWIYSDHGQIATQPYIRQQGRSLEQAVVDIFNQLERGRAMAGQHTQESIQTQRVRLLGGKRFQRLFAVMNDSEEGAGEKLLGVAAVGPVGFVYPPDTLDPRETRFIAQELVGTANIPLVVTQEGDQLKAWTRRGIYDLPQQTAEVFGEDHPFLDEIKRDIVTLCRHPYSGDFALFAWEKMAGPLSFAHENGSHAGVSPSELRAFALLPSDAPLPENNKDYLTVSELRAAALQQLGRKDPHALDKTRYVPPAPAKTLRIMTYNVHSCVGMDGKLSPERIARVIARANPDVVALQELDVGRSRTDNKDQAHMIAHYLEMDFHFHPAMSIEEERYGDAILTHLPMRVVKASALPGVAGKPRLEPRGALWVTIETGAGEIQILNTHLGLLPRERLAQTEALLGTDWLAHEPCHDPVILCGDFNALPSSKVCHLLGEHLLDAQLEADAHQPRSTFFGRFPLLRIDHVFLGKKLEVLGVQVLDCEMARVASDHLPLIVDVRICETDAESPARRR